MKSGCYRTSVRSTDLTAAEKRVVASDRDVMRQRQIIDVLERGGRDITAATELLRRFEAAHVLSVQRRDQLLDQPEIDEKPAP